MSEATLQVPKDVIEPIIRQHVEKAIAEALVGRDELISACVQRVLEQKVNSEGKNDCYVQHNSPTWLNWVMNEALKTAVKAAVVEEVGKHKEAIKKSIASELKKTNSPLVKQLINGMVGAMTNENVLKYRLTVAYDDGK